MIISFHAYYFTIPYEIISRAENVSQGFSEKCSLFLFELALQH